APSRAGRSRHSLHIEPVSEPRLRRGRPKRRSRRLRANKRTCDGLRPDHPQRDAGGRAQRTGRRRGRRPHRRRPAADWRGSEANDRCARLSSFAAVRRLPLPHGRDAVARPAPAQRLRGVAGRDCALGRTEASTDARSGRRARLPLLHLAVSQGLLAVRSHVDVCDDRLLAVEALLEVRKKVKPYLDLQLVAFPQDGYFRAPNAAKNLERALDRGVEVVGGIPHFERTMAEGARSVTALCEIAARRGLMVDLHCDETDDPMSRHIETLACEAQRFGLGDRATGSHLTSMHSMDNYYVSKLLPLIAESGLCAIANPLINLTLQGRHDTYPRRRGM